MAGITATYESGCLRLYRTFSYRDSNNKPQRVRKSIGKVDPKTGKPVFNHFFKNILLKQNIPLDRILNIPYHEIPNHVDFGNCSKENLINRFIVTDSEDDYVNYDIKTIDLSIKASENNEMYAVQDDNQEVTIQKTDLMKNILKIESYNGQIYDFVERKFTCKGIGSKFILDSILGNTGLLQILSQIFPFHYEKIITLAFYLVADNSAVSYCDDWLDRNETLIDDSSKMCSQRLSELFKDITSSQIQEFWESWSNHIAENEYLALDITSISSYANLISEVEYGYNRDNDKLPQINLCMLFGENSALPAFSSIYNGSLNDSKILKSFLEKLELFGDKKYKLVIDKGFYSKENIMFMLKKYPKYDFMMAVPFTTSIAKKIVLEGKQNLESDMPIGHNTNVLVGYSFIDKLNNNYSIIYHVLYNEYKYDDAKKCLKDKAFNLRQEAISDPEKFMHEKDHKKYLIFNKDKQTGNYTIRINLERINYEIRHSGWLIIASNDLTSTYYDALMIYRNKDIVEKSFNRLKNSLSFNRMRVHKSNSLQGKMFIAMISLIISSYMYKVMITNNLDSKYTLTRLLNKLETLKIDKHDNLSTISPITKELRNIFHAFGVKIS
jgi:transposase